jgi:hypothetical protein
VRILGLVLALVLLAPTTAGAEPFVALTHDQSIIAGDTTAPATADSAAPIPGLDPNEFIAGIDAAPGGAIFLLVHDGRTNTLRIYRYNVNDGTATLVSSSGANGPVAFYGFDFQPVTQELRVVTDQGTNLRMDSTSGNLIANDTPLSALGVGAVAYGGETLYGINLESDQLVMIGGPGGSPSPDGGQVTPLGPLGVDVNGFSGFDISSGGTAYAALQTGPGGSQLYRIDLATGAATPVGPIGAGNVPIRGIAVPPADGPGPQPSDEVVTVGIEVRNGTWQLQVTDLDGGDPESPGSLGRAFRGGATPVAGDWNGDGDTDLIVGADKHPKGGGAVRVLAPDGTRIANFFPFGRGFHGGVTVAAGDVNGDGAAEVFAGSGSGRRAEVRVFDAAGQVGTLRPYGDFRGGVNVATGDFNGDGGPDLVVAPQRGDRPVRRYGVLDLDFVFGASVRPYGRSFQGGVNVAVGDVNGDGSDELLTAPEKGRQPVRTFAADGTRLASFFPYARDFRGGVSVAVGDVNGDGQPDVVTGQERGRQVRTFDAATQQQLSSFFAYEPGFRGGVGVAAGDLR